ncbi:MAG: glycosyltransferase family 2 protein [Candidatus Omnitrophica bacterium]|nr:glycosyltransferase family 2 protein [Candidatus Omnitrophota bacterium]MDD5672316.1 glycosyltransferase family 2 protein [Candidatus Omnitrophota bacterium]
MADHRSLSIIIPAYNEEGNIRATVDEIGALARKYLTDYEILVFDDASRDRTSEIVGELQKKDPHVKLVRNVANRGLGFNYRAGVLMARCRYVIMVPGDNEVMAESLEEVFRQIGKTDIIICYAANPEFRSVWRQRISRMFTGSLNFLFGFKVSYYNGPNVLRTDMARAVVPDTSSFAYMAVMLVELLKGGATFQELTFALRRRQYGKTKAFKLKNIYCVVRDVLVAFWKVALCRRYKKL